MIDWLNFKEKTKNLLKANNLSEARQEIQSGLAAIPNQVNLLTIATDVYRASGDREKSLEYAELLITHHPKNWNGYGLAAQDLIALKRFDQAQERIQAGLEKIPNQLNLLTIATDVYRASGDREKSLEYAELLITHHPDNWIGYGRAAQDLTTLKRFDQAERILKDAKSLDNNDLTKIRADVSRWKFIPKLVQMMKCKSVRDYPSFCIAGNCQASSLAKWLSSNFPFCEINTLTPYHLIKSQPEIDTWIDKAMNSDFAIMIPISESYGGFQFGSNYVKSLLSEEVKFILYPSFHLEVFYPFFGYAKNEKGATLMEAEVSVRGNIYGGCHDFLAMALSTRDKNTQEKFNSKAREINNSTSFKSNIIRDIGLRSFNEFQKRYPDYIDIFRLDIRNGIVHTFNHPTGRVLNEIYKILWKKDFGLAIDGFLDFKEDLLKGIKLPIPSFVSRAILEQIDDVPWAISNTNNIGHKHEDIDDYVVKIKNSIKFYQANPEILRWNANHKKLSVANDFLLEIDI